MGAAVTVMETLMGGGTPALPDAMITVPENVPGVVNVAGFTANVSVDGVAPLAGVTISHGAPETESVKARLGAFPVRVTVWFAGVAPPI